MRIAELADLTETTVRTIRYYHQIGLLPIPPQRDGRRDYDLSHLARLVRIRWLRQAGIPLTAITAMLDETPAVATDGSAPVLTDLRAAVDSVDVEIQRLHDRRDRLLNLIDAVERDGHLSPMPASMVRFYDQMYARATDPQTRRVIRRERDFMELAFYRGDMPPESAAVYEGFTDTGLVESSALFGQIAERNQHGDHLDPQEMDRIAAAVVGRVARHLGSDLPRLLRTIDLNVARRAVDLYVRLAEPNERRIAQVIGDAVLAMIEKGQAE
ncbi:MerR family transcriptional regulator [Actinoplanes sp. NPDC024001]|uniref:helix-turn-helix domain-containing protein n=1 Tax=unclassified Actinoplanes TaxID=2626549 RepID=UPI002E1FCF9E